MQLKKGDSITSRFSSACCTHPIKRTNAHSVRVQMARSTTIFDTHKVRIRGSVTDADTVSGNNRHLLLFSALRQRMYNVFQVFPERLSHVLRLLLQVRVNER